MPDVGRSVMHEIISLSQVQDLGVGGLCQHQLSGGLAVDHAKPSFYCHKLICRALCMALAQCVNKSALHLTCTLPGSQVGFLSLW